MNKFRVRTWARYRAWLGSFDTVEMSASLMLAGQTRRLGRGRLRRPENAGQSLPDSRRAEAED
jgi:hypothetical protein